MTNTSQSPGLTRRELIQGVAALLGGTSLIGGDGLLVTLDARTLDEALAQGTGAFTAADVAFLDEIAETMLPETTTPGAKAAKTGAFMALMVTANYTERDQKIFRDGMLQVDAECRTLHKVSFMQASPSQKLALLEKLDREQKAVMDERAGEPRSRTPAPPASDDRPRPYFRLMKELALLGFFTSEVGYTKAMRYIESPGRFNPCVPHAPGDKTWASHA